MSRLTKQILLAQSGKVQEKLGFKVKGKVANFSTWIDGKQTDLIQRKMTRNEYFKIYKRKKKTKKSEK